MSNLTTRRRTWGAATTLGFVMAGHMLLETGRDALFLANVSVERLPFVTIGVALLALGASRIDGGRENRVALIALLLATAVGTASLSVLVLASREWSFYVLYLWSGTVTSVVVVRLWLLLGDLFTIREGKRAFASIAMGGSIGALVGSAVAALFASYFPAEVLLVVAAAAFAASAVGPAWMLAPKHAAPGLRRDHGADRVPWAESVNSLLRNPYACRIALLVVVGAITLTLGDYLFKSVLTLEVEREELAEWLSRIYLGLNVLSIAMLAIGVTPVVRRVGVDRSLVVLPALVGLAALGVLAGGALAATIFLKMADGTLRYSLHRTATELLYLPMSSSLRSKVKTGIDLAGQTGGKAIASIMILALVLTPDPSIAVACAVVVSAGLWVGLALRLRVAYLNVFRDTLQDGVIDTVLDHPELDLASAGSLIRALSDPDEQRSIAAIRLLVERGQGDLIPSLIVYHPSPRVVVHALDLFALIQRDDLEHLIRHLIEHESADVRAAAVRAAWALDHSTFDLHGFLDSPCLVVRVSASAGLFAKGEIEVDAFRDVLDEVLSYEPPDARLATARAAGLAYQPIYREALLRMALDEDVQVAHQSIDAICASHDEWFTPHLVDLLGERRIRAVVRNALIEGGMPALQILSERLVDERTPISVLRHIPVTVARFSMPAAARVLSEALSHIDNGMMHFKLLRGLETIQRARIEGKGLERGAIAQIDPLPLQKAFERTLARSTRLLELEKALLALQASSDRFETVAGELLVELIEDKRELATGRLFMMLGLMHPNEDFALIYDGLRSTRPSERESAAELIETLLAHGVATRILAQVAGRRLTREDRSKNWTGASPEAAFERVVRMAESDASQSVRAVALYYADELGFDLSVLETQTSAATASGALRSTTRREKGEPTINRGLRAVRELFDTRRTKTLGTAR